MIRLSDLRTLAANNAVRSLELRGTAGGFALFVNEQPFVTERANVRVWRLETVARFLRDMGLGRVTVDLSSWDYNTTIKGLF